MTRRLQPSRRAASRSWTHLALAAAVSLTGVQARADWQVFRAGAGMPRDSVTCILADRSGNYWFGTDNSGLLRYDGVRWTHVTKADGLAGSHVSCIVEDLRGGIWVSFVPGLVDVGNGVSRFEGSTWTTLDESDGLASNQVFSMLADRDGNIWFGTDTGLVSRYDGSSWFNFDLAALSGSSVSGWVLDILQDRAGQIWFASGIPYVSNGGIVRYDGSSWDAFTTSNGLATDFVSSIVEDPSGIIWCTYGGSPLSGLGLGRYDGTGWIQIVDYDNPIFNDFISSFLDLRGDLWFGTSFPGAVRYRGVDRQYVVNKDGIGGSRVRTISGDAAGNVWFATDQGLTRFDPSSWRTFAAGAELGGEPRAMLEDRSGKVWIGAWPGGVSRYDGDSWTRFTATDGLGGEQVTAMLEDRLGNVWVGTWDGGVSRYDGTTWRAFTTADGLAANAVLSLLEDSSGNLWVGTYDGGASKFDGSTWVTYRKSDGLAGSIVLSMLEDDEGDIWFRTNVNVVDLAGLTRFDGSAWKVYTTADGLPSNSVSALRKDHSGHVWVAFSTGEAGYGVARLDGTTWTNYTAADGLAGNNVTDIYVDRAGALWSLSTTGLSKFDGTSWDVATAADGLISNRVTTMHQGRDGVYWFATEVGLSRYDGSIWRTFTTSNGLAHDWVQAILEEGEGTLWFGTQSDVTRHVPDLVPPVASLASTPLPLSTSRLQTAFFAAAFGELEGIEFSSRFDGGAWSEWSPRTDWVRDGIPDGAHTLEVRARDYVGNTSPSPRVATFEVDATPPAPVITSPPFGSVVRGSVSVRGSSDDARLKETRILARPAGKTTWNLPAATLLGQTSLPIRDGLLTTWNTMSLPDGVYELRVAASDSLGLEGAALGAAIIDNHAPFADVTAPAIVTASAGGDIFTTNGEAHLYFPPHAFTKDALVTIEPLAASADSIAPGVTRLTSGFQVSWLGAVLEKAARLELSYAGMVLPPGYLAVYRSVDGATWERLGGTVEAEAQRVAFPLERSGRFAVFVESRAYAGSGGLSGISFTPRVFSPAGGYGAREVGIGFTLGRPASVTVRVFSRSGRLVREILAGRPMAAGANLVRWDGTDRNGRIVMDGVYLVTVESLGRTERRTLAIVR